MKFQRIAILGVLPAVEGTQAGIQALSTAPVSFPSDEPSDPSMLLQRARNADAVVVTWQTKLDRSFFVANPQLRFVAMPASPYVDRSQSPIDLDAAAEHGVVVSALGQYGDEATAEWVLASILNAAHHITEPHWRSQRTELFDKTLGIIGLSHVGAEVAKRAAAMGMRIAYSSRGPKPFAVALGYERLPLDELLARSDVVSVHIAKGVLAVPDLSRLKPDALLLNTSIGQVIAPSALDSWLESGGCCLSDATVDTELADVMRRYGRASVRPMSAADTKEMHQRRSDQLVDNLGAFLRGEPMRVVS